MSPNEEKEGWHYPAVKKIIGIIKRNNLKTPQQFSLFELSSFFCSKKQT